MEIVNNKKNHRGFSSSLLWQIIDSIYPPFCIGCGQIGFEICKECISNIEIIGLNQICDFCGAPLSNSKTQHRCRKKKEFLLSELKSFSFYTGLMQKIIREFKFQRRIGIPRDLLPSLRDYFMRWQPEIDLIVPVTLSRKRKKQRGYNQSAILGKGIAGFIRVDYSEKALIRIRNTRTQVGLNYAQRKVNVKDAFEADKRFVNDKSILLVDDITTTGSTINECAKAVIQKGANKVYGFTLARPKNNFMQY